MHWFHQILFRLQPLFRKKRIEADLSEEIQTHLAMLEAVHVAAGLTPGEARHAARREFGGVEQIKESYRAERGFAWIGNFGRDLRFGFRAVRRHPGFSAVAILTLAVAIGINSAIFSLVNGVLLHNPVPFKPEQVACIFTASQNAARDFRQFSFAEFTALRESPEVFSDVAALNFNFVAIGREAGLRRSFAFMVSENFFPLMGVKPVAGRFFTAAECRPNAGERVLISSHELWQRSGGLPDFIGSHLVINGQPHLVVGVTPPGFSGVSALIAPEIWLPFGLFADVTAAFGEGRRINDLASPANHTLNLFGRLQPGLTLTSAKPLLPVLAARLTALQGRDSAGSRELILARPFSISPTPQDDGPLKLLGILLLGMSGIVLLIACLNLANMLLARGTVRAGEIAVRLAIGASRGQIVSQLLTEGLVLAVAGGALGLVFSSVANSLLQNIGVTLLGSMNLTLTMQLRPDFTVVAITFVFCLGATLLFSLFPALKAARADLVHDLKSPGGDSGTSGRWNRFFAGRHLLVMAQMTLSVVLVFAAGLFIRGAMRAGSPEIGFTTTGVMLAELDFSLANTTPAEAQRRMGAAVERIRRFPGVRAAGLSTLMPYKNEITTVRIVPAHTSPTDPAATPRGVGAIHAAISPDYLGSIGVRILRGRDFSESEARGAGSPRACLIDEGLAARLFSGADALGQLVRQASTPGGAPAHEMEIVGITARHNQDVLDKNRPAPRLYVPLGQADYHANVFLSALIPRADDASLANTMGVIRQELHQLDPDLPVIQLLPFTQYVEKSFNLWMGRIGAAMFGVFGGVALLLAVLGVYGVKAYAVQRRTREIGIRIALGATRRDIFSLMMKQGALQTVFSVALGLLLSLPVGRALAYFLYGVNATDPLVLVVAAAVLGGATLVACFVPARRATQISPMRALRTE